MSDTTLKKTNIRNTQIEDVQAKHDYRHIYINKVGITNVKYPLQIRNGDEPPQPTIAKVSMFVFLPEEKKGTHMSRFLEILNTHKEMDISHPKELLTEIKTKLNTKEAYIELDFPYFLEKTAPVSKKQSVIDYQIKIKSSINEKQKVNTELNIEIPVTTLCPCSKEISNYGAHSQRGIINITIRYKERLNLKKFIEEIENCSSSPLYPILKREDEKYVTEKAYDSPVFVEDLARNIALKMEHNEIITYYKCEVENYESIHKHNAYAMIERDFRD